MIELLRYEKNRNAIGTVPVIHLPIDREEDGGVAENGRCRFFAAAPGS